MTAALFVLLHSMGASFASPDELRHRPEAGDVRFYDITSGLEMTRSAEGGRPESMDTKLRLRCRVEVLEVGETDFRVAVRWVASSGRVGVPLLGAVEFDSELEPDLRGIAGGIREPWLRLVGVEYRARIDRQGRVLELPEVEAALQGARRRVREGSNPRMVKGLLEVPALRSQLRLLFPLYPEAAVARGDRWSGAIEDSIANSQRMQLAGPAETEVLAVSGSRVTLRVATSELELDGRTPDSAHRDQVLIVDPRDGSLLRQRVEGELATREKSLFRGVEDSSARFRAVAERVSPRRSP